jgi:hypothetical protein
VIGVAADLGALRESGNDAAFTFGQLVNAGGEKLLGELADLLFRRHAFARVHEVSLMHPRERGD